MASQCGGGRGTGYFAHESQCDRYYICENGQVVNEGLCDDGLVFNEYGNPSRLKCELPFGIDCSNRPNLRKLIVIHLISFRESLLSLKIN